MSKARKYLLCGLTAWGMLITLLRAFRLPNDYAEAHWLVDYRFGFIKRGLIGTMFSLWSHYTQMSQTEWAITVLSLIMLGTFCFILLAIAHRILVRLDWDGNAFLFVNVFLTSPFIVMSAHFVGYYDNILIVLTFCTVSLLLHHRYWIAALLQVVLVLIHENYILLGMPWVLLTSILITNSKTTDRQDFTSFLPVCPPLLVFVALAFYQSNVMDQLYLETMLTTRLSSFDFIEIHRNVLVPQWLLTSFPSFLQTQYVFFLQRVMRLDMLIAMALPAFVLLYFTARKFSMRLMSGESFLVMSVVLAPLAMHVIAWDTERIWTYVLIGAFSVTWLYGEITPSWRHGRVPYFGLVAFPTLMLNIFNRIPLMDGEIERLTNRERLLFYAPLLISLFTATYSCHPAKQAENVTEENSPITKP